MYLKQTGGKGEENQNSTIGPKEKDWKRNQKKDQEKRKGKITNINFSDSQPMGIEVTNKCILPPVNRKEKEKKKKIT